MKRLFILILALLTALMMASCKKAEEPAEPEADTDSGYRRTTLYYATEDGFIVPVMKSIPWEEGIGRAALSYLDGLEDGNTRGNGMYSTHRRGRQRPGRPD